MSTSTSSSRPAGFDKTNHACTACYENKAESIVRCLNCTIGVHPSCYTSASSSRAFLCHSCSSGDLDSHPNQNHSERHRICVMCTRTSDIDGGIMQRIDDEDMKRLQCMGWRNAATTTTTSSIVNRYAHTFCLKMSHHPNATPLNDVSTTRCQQCQRLNARLRCRTCTTGYHPQCALRGINLMSHTPSGQIAVHCSEHRRSTALSSVSPAVKKEKSSSPTVSKVPVPLKLHTTNTSTPTPTPSTQLISSSQSNRPIITSAQPMPSSSSSSGDFIPCAPRPHATESSVARSRRFNLSLSSSSSSSSSITSLSSIGTTPPLHSSMTNVAAVNSSSKGVPSRRASQQLIAATTSNSVNTSLESSVVTPSRLSRLTQLDTTGTSAKSQFKKQLQSSTPAQRSSVNVISDDDDHSTTPKRVTPTTIKSSMTTSKATSRAPTSSSSASIRRAIPLSSSSSSSPYPPTKKSLPEPSASRILAGSSVTTAAASAAKRAITKVIPDETDEEEEDEIVVERKSKTTIKKKPMNTSSPSNKKSNVDTAGKKSKTSTVSVDLIKKRLTKASVISDSSESDSDSDDELNLDLRTEEIARRKKKRALDEIKDVRMEEKSIDDDKCRVCGEDWAEDDKDEDGNLKENAQNDEMVGCDKCQGWYHQSCYGISELPEGDYLCRPCAAGKEKNDVRCVICHSKEWRGFCHVQYGPKTDPDIIKKAKKSPHFAHISCVFWHPETDFDIAEERNPALHIELIPKARYHLHCTLCSRRSGAKIQCQFKDCVTSFHVLCMMRHTDTHYFDAHEEDEDTSDSLRPNKEFYCKFHSIRPLLQRQRQRLIDEGESTSDIDAELNAPAKVVPTIGLLPASKLVAVVAPKQGGRSKKIVIEVDPEDQETRAKEYDQAVKSERIKIEGEEEEEMKHGVVDENGDIDMTPTKRKRKKTGIDAELSDHDSSDDDDASTTSSIGGGGSGSGGGRKRLKKLSSSEKRIKLERVTDDDDEASSRASSPLLASSHPLSTNYRAPYKPSSPIPHMIIESGTTQVIDFRSRVRGQLTDLLSSSDLADSIEAELYAYCGREALDSLYRNKLKDLLFNLRKNSLLVDQVNRGVITPAHLVTMTNSEMASPSLQATRQREAKNELIERTLAPQSIIVKPSGQLVAIDIATSKMVQ